MFRNFQVSLSTILLLLIVALPTTVSGIYYFFLASDRYVVEVMFTVRGVQGGQGGGLKSLFRTFGITRAEDDTYAVIDFILSRDGVRKLNERYPLKPIFNAPGVDIFSSYPKPWRGDSLEALYEYYLNRVEAWYESKGGMVTMRVSAFRAEDAVALARALLDLSEQLVNEMNTSAHADAIAYAEKELRRAEDRVIEAQSKITGFRNSELILDPVADSKKLVDLTSHLKEELADAQRQLNETLEGSPSNPSLLTFRSRIIALRSQIAAEASKIGSGASPLASKIQVYERLMLDRQFADKNLGIAIEMLQNARQDARRQQLYIETVVSPHMPDEPFEPRSIRYVSLVFVIGLAAFSMIWLIIAGSREHMHG
jgi:capsular polysaccharide transport system permease protein